jgi:hypothetical protein
VGTAGSATDEEDHTVMHQSDAVHHHLRQLTIICFAILWAETAKRVGCSAFWGVMVLFPFINFVSLGLMA